MYFLNPNVKREYEIIFRKFDKDNDGEIDGNDLMFLMRLLGQNPSFAEVQDMINEVDDDGTGTINFTEFIKIMENGGIKDVDLEETLWLAFNAFDKDKNGFIDPNELKEVIAKLGEPLTEEEFEDMMAEVDLDKDGRIDCEEFFLMMSK